jgi:RNA polymerase sigma-70 factor (ECF subfamily)
MAPTGPAPEAAIDPEALLGKALAGDAESFWKLVKPHERTIFATALGVVRDAERAEDVLHETYLRAFRTLGGLRTPSKLAGWLHAMARNIAHETIRRSQREERAISEAPVAPPVVPVTELWVREEELALLERCLGELPEQHRVVLGLKYMQNMSCRDIAETLDIGVEATKSRLFEARKALLRRMKAAERQAPSPAFSERGEQTSSSGGRP